MSVIVERENKVVYRNNAGTVVLKNNKFELIEVRNENSCVLHFSSFSNLEIFSTLLKELIQQVKEKEFDKQSYFC